MYTIQSFVASMGGYFSVINAFALTISSFLLYPMLTKHVTNQIEPSDFQSANYLNSTVKNVSEVRNHMALVNKYMNWPSIFKAAYKTE